MRDVPFCYWHSPDHADELAEARRMGGYHRRKKRSVAAIYDFDGMSTVDGLQSFLETITIETMTLENSIARNRAIGGFIAVAAKLLESGDIAERLAALEAVAKQPEETGDLD